LASSEIELTVNIRRADGRVVSYDKGVGRLALRVEGIAAKDHALLAEVIQFLNRMGHGDAPKWLKALNIAQYESQVLNKLKDFCATVQLAIRRSLDARVGKLLPEIWRSKID
jgi:hypothetical protein